MRRARFAIGADRFSKSLQRFIPFAPRVIQHPELNVNLGKLRLQFNRFPKELLGASEVRDVLERPVLTRVPVRPAIARAVDAGVIAVRPPEPLLRAASRLLDRVGGAADDLRRVS